MKKQKKFKNYDKHLRNYITLSMLVSLAMMILTALALITSLNPESFNLSLPTTSHVLGLFISSMMTIMGLYYFNTLKK